MARSINTIQDTILEAKAQAQELSALEVLTTQEQNINQVDTGSKVSIWRLWVWIFAMASWTLESLWDIFRSDVETRIAATRPHTKDWYRGKALDYMHGVALVPEADYYDTTAMTTDEIAAAKIIANAAPVKEVLYGNGRLRMKVVKLQGDDYAPLTNDELTAFSAYMNEVTDAGTQVVATSGPADMLKLELDIYYDPTILNAFGQRLDGTDPTPVQNGIKAYLKSLKFNGSFIKTKLTNDLEAIQGVKYPSIKSAWSKYGGYGYEAESAPNAGLINEIRVADAGWMQLDEDELVINWIATEE